MSAGLIVSRFLHFASVLLLFGAAAFPLYAFREEERTARTILLIARLRPFLIGAAAVAFLSAVSWLAFASATMSGSLANAVSADVIGAVIRETDFGRIWIWRIGLAALLLILTLPKSNSEALAFAQMGAAALLLTSIAVTGHAGADATSLGTFHVAADSLHLLAASAWLGGLVSLALVIGPQHIDIPDTAAILKRFSAMGILAVAALIASGIVNSVLEIESFAAVAGTAYGRWLTFKVVLLAGMLVFAYANRNRLTPALVAMPDEPAITLRRLRMNIMAEQALGLVILGIVAYLGTIDPSR